MFNNPEPEDGDTPLLVMEYFERCDLHELLIRINEAKSNNPDVHDSRKRLEFIPNRILWRLFLCRKLMSLPFYLV